MNSHSIRVSEACPAAPGGSFRKFGPGSGQEFREDHLLPALKMGGEAVTVILDGRRGYGAGFLEEAFAGLIYKGHFSRETLRKRLTIIGEGSLNECAAVRALRFIDKAMSGRLHNV